MNCSQKRTDAKIAVEENGMSFRLENPKRREIVQIRSTMEYTKQKYASYRREAYIVSSRVPRASPSTQQKQAQLKRDYSTSLQIKNKDLVVSVS